jgi:hypothetical protein
MIKTLQQKHPIRGTREFRLSDDEVQYSIQSPVKSESLSVVLSVLDADPVIAGSTLSFVSLVNREPLVEFFLDKPNKAAFDEFISVMRARIIDEDFARRRVKGGGSAVDRQGVRESIEMLRTYVNPDDIGDLLDALTALEASPDDAACLVKVADAFNALGFVQGQVITYAPYINFLLSGMGEQSDDAGDRP